MVNWNFEISSLRHGQQLARITIERHSLEFDFYNREVEKCFWLSKQNKNIESIFVSNAFSNIRALRRSNVSPLFRLFPFTSSKNMQSTNVSTLTSRVSKPNKKRKEKSSRKICCAIENSVFSDAWSCWHVAFSFARLLRGMNSADVPYLSHVSLTHIHRCLLMWKFCLILKLSANLFHVNFFLDLKSKIGGIGFCLSSEKSF